MACKTMMVAGIVLIATAPLAAAHFNPTESNLFGPCGNNGRTSHHLYFLPGGASVVTGIPAVTDGQLPSEAVQGPNANWHSASATTHANGHVASSTVFNTCSESVPTLNSDCILEDLTHTTIDPNPDWLDPLTLVEAILAWLLGDGAGPYTINWGCPDETYVESIGGVWDGDYEIGWAGAFLPDEPCHHQLNQNRFASWDSVCVLDNQFGATVPFVIGADVDDDGDVERSTGPFTGCGDTNGLPAGGPYTGAFGGYWVFVDVAYLELPWALDMGGTYGHICTGNGGC